MCNENMKQRIAELLCDYKSTRYIRVRNVKLSVIYWITLFFILIYVVVFTIFVDKGYQATDTVSGTTSIKLKGSASIGDFTGPLADVTPLDAMDLVQPSMEENAFFVITAMTLTPNQTREINCAGNGDSPECVMEEDTSACNKNIYDPDSQGIFTGICGSNGRCEMYAWCPLENDTNPLLVNNVGALTAFVKININFERFGVDRNNIYDKYGAHPTYGYNLFSVDDIVSKATNGAMMTKDVSARGAIILVSSVWNCNLDRDEDECNPEFKFKRIDGAKGTISKGYNYRTVTYDTLDRTRYLRKYYGVRVIFIVEGTAGKFDIVSLTVTLGAGLAYLGIAAVVADFVLEHFLPESQSYCEAKHRHIVHSDDTIQIGLTSALEEVVTGYTKSTDKELVATKNYV